MKNNTISFTLIINIFVAMHATQASQEFTGSIFVKNNTKQAFTLVTNLGGKKITTQVQPGGQVPICPVDCKKDFFIDGDLEFPSTTMPLRQEVANLYGELRKNNKKVGIIVIGDKREDGGWPIVEQKIMQ